MSRLAVAIGIAGVGLTLRLLGLAWGLPAVGEAPFHPDEHVVFQAAESLYEDPDLMTFVWGGALYPRTGFAARALVDDPTDPMGGFRATIVALRLLNALLGLVTAAAVAVIVWRMFGAAAAGVGAALFLCLPGPVLDSHFARPDVMAACFATASLTCACALARTGSARLLWIGAGLAGLGSATLLSAIVVFPPLLVAWLEGAPPRRRRAGPAAGAVFAIAIAGLAGYVLGSFESLLHPDALRAGLARAAASHSEGHYGLPTALLTRVPLYAFGIPATLAGLLGLGFLLQSRLPGSLTVAAWVVTGLLLLGRVGGDMMRHLLFLAPALAVAAAALFAFASSAAPRHRGLVAAATGLVLAYTLQLSGVYAWGLQFDRDARVRAGHWLVEHAPVDASVGLTPSFHGDRTYLPRFPREHRLRLAAWRPGAGDAAMLAGADFDYVVTTDYARDHAPTPAARAFLLALFDGEGYGLAASFGPRIAPLRLLDAFTTRSPSDLLYTRSVFYVFERQR